MPQNSPNNTKRYNLSSFILKPLTEPLNGLRTQYTITYPPYVTTTRVGLLLGLQASPPYKGNKDTHDNP